MDKTTRMKTLTDRQININKITTNKQSNTNADINRQTKQQQYKHQNIEKKTPMKSSTDRKKQHQCRHQQID